MYKLDLPIDLKEKAAIERRRQLEKERQSRIFNNKQRLIGVSKFDSLGIFLHYAATYIIYMLDIFKGR